MLYYGTDNKIYLHNYGRKVLVMAGQLKRENPDIQEDLVLIRALRDSNLPKFLADDAILFKVIRLNCGWYFLYAESCCMCSNSELNYVLGDFVRSFSWSLTAGA